MKELTTKILKQSISKAYKAINKEDMEVHNLARVTVRDGYVVKIYSDGKIERIKKAEFGYVKVNAEDFSL